MTTILQQDFLQKMAQSLDTALEFDENGQCLLLLGKKLMVSIRSLDNAWIFYGMLGNLLQDDEENDEDPADIVQALLARNLALLEASGAGIAIEESSGAIMLVLRVATSGMDGERMKEALDSFVGQLSHTIAAFAGEEEEAQAPSPVNFPPEPGFFERA